MTLPINSYFKREQRLATSKTQSFSFWSPCLYLSLFVFLSFCLSVFLSFCLSICLSVCLSFLSFCLKIFLSTDSATDQIYFLRRKRCYQSKAIMTEKHSKLFFLCSYFEMYTLTRKQNNYDDHRCVWDLIHIYDDDFQWRKDKWGKFCTLYVSSFFSDCVCWVIPSNVNQKWSNLTHDLDNFSIFRCRFIKGRIF